MCPIENWDRKTQVMKFDFFARILENLKPYAGNVEYTSLHGCGEPLMDKSLPQKIELARKLGFGNIHFATNGTELTEKTARKLLDSGLHEMICSIDGITKETHEAIRVRTNFDDVKANVLRFIKMRNEGGYNTKVFIRFIKQKLNAHEWQAYEAFWRQEVDPTKGDRVSFIPVHNWGEGDFTDHLNATQKPTGVATYCQDLFERVYIYASGKMALCCADDNGWYDLGDASVNDPVELFNTSPVFQHHRDLITAGKIAQLDHCKDCTLPFVRKQRNY